jgi:branched-subunit amino acid ABC-type transport system permease component
MDIITLGLVVGMANALLAMGLVLIYMSNRVINLAHGEFGAFAVAMMLALTRNARLNYWLALLCTLAATGTLAAMIERGILRRLFRSPRLIVLIATIGVSQLVIVLRLILPKPSARFGEDFIAGGAQIFPLPFRFESFEFGRVVIGPAHILALVAGPLLALVAFLFLRYSAYGIALRASAQNMQRARLLGIPVLRVSTIAWVFAGVLAGVGGILLAPIIGYSPGEAVGLPLLMRGLAAAMVARMESVGIAFGVGLGLGALDQLIFFWTGRSGLTDLVLLGVILLTLLSRRVRSSRADAADESSWEAAEPVRSLPLEVKAHPAWRSLASIALVIAAGLVVLLPWPLGDSTTFFLATVLLFSVVAVSATVLTGWAGQMSLGQWAIAGVGGVFGAKLVVDLGLQYWTAFVIAAGAGAVGALLLGLPALRLEGTALAVVTLGFAVASASWLFEQSWFQGTGFMERPSFMTTPVYYFVALAMVLITIAATRIYHRSRIGRNMVAVRDNPLQAAAFGVGIVRTKLTAFMFAGALAAGAGFLWSTGVGLADSSVFGPVRSLSIMAVVVIGGLGSVSGAIGASFYFLAFPYFLAERWENIGLIASGVGVLFLVLLLPGGFARVLYGARDLLAKWLTGIDVRPRVQRVSEEPVHIPRRLNGAFGEARGSSASPGLPKRGKTWNPKSGSRT